MGRGRPRLGNIVETLSDYSVIVGTRGERFIVDTEDLPILSGFTWGTYSDAYAGAGVGKGSDRRILLMHRFLLGLQPGDKRQVDHADGNPLNNRRSNLRIASSSQNGGNIKKRKPNKAGFKGVYQQGKSWRASICCNGTIHKLGLFNNPEAAARAYDLKAIELFGEFASLNFTEPMTGTEVRRQRQEAVVSQSLLAFYAGIDYRELNRYERNETELPLIQPAKLASGLAEIPTISFRRVREMTREAHQHFGLTIGEDRSESEPAAA